MKKFLKIISASLITAMLIPSVPMTAAEEDDVVQAEIAGDVDPTQWVAIDGLGREMPTNEQVGDAKEKVVGMFYWTWHQQLMTSQPPTNLTEFMKEHPDAKNDYDHEAWNETKGSYFWNEPIYGFYSGVDEYVLRKQAELLADAGVDFVAFDCTNSDYTWDSAYLKLLKVWEEARIDGVDVPQVTFMLNFASLDTTKTAINKIYQKLYSKEKYKDLWFYWDDKPLMIAHPEVLEQDPDFREICKFFTFRRNVASYFEGDMDNEYWGWLHVYPQALYNVKRKNIVEMTTVGVAMNASAATQSLMAMNGTDIMGRSYAAGDYSYSYTYKGQTVTVDENIENSSLYGRNFQQQWDYAIEQDPQIIFVTGWNEWIASRFQEWGGVENAFPDTFDDEYSRDIEPTKGELKDHYYNQLVYNIRKFKGVSKTLSYAANKTIDIKGDASQWDFDGVAIFNHYTDSTYERNDRGYGNASYQSNTMRNDIVQARVAYDADNIYFYVRTVDALSPTTDSAWMRLFIDTAAPTADGKAWEEYEYVINRTSPTEKATLERSKGGWDWEKVADLDYSVNGNVLQIAVPRTALGLTDMLDFNFKWSDNMQTDGDIMDFYTAGDVAPGARFMFDFNADLSADIPGDATDVGTTAGDTEKPGDNNLGAIIGVVCAGVAVVAAVGAVVIIKKKKK